MTDNVLVSFMRTNLLMGYHNRSSLRNFWSYKKDFNAPLVSSALSRNRFQQILTNLHLNDNQAMPRDNADKLHKNDLWLMFRMLCNINEHVSINESMILFKGRSSLKQYNPMKPIKRGYKI